MSNHLAGLIRRPWWAAFGCWLALVGVVTWGLDNREHSAAVVVWTVLDVQAEGALLQSRGTFRLIGADGGPRHAWSIDPEQRGVRCVDDCADGVVTPLLAWAAGRVRGAREVLGGGGLRPLSAEVVAGGVRVNADRGSATRAGLDVRLSPVVGGSSRLVVMNVDSTVGPVVGDDGRPFALVNGGVVASEVGRSWSADLVPGTPRCIDPRDGAVAFAIYPQPGKLVVRRGDRFEAVGPAVRGCALDGDRIMTVDRPSEGLRILGPDAPDLTYNVAFRPTRSSPETSVTVRAQDVLPSADGRYLALGATGAYVADMDGRRLGEAPGHSAGWWLGGHAWVIDQAGAVARVV